MRKSWLLVLFTLVIASGAYSDDKSLGTYLSKVGSIYGQAYIQPFSNAFGADINSGWFHNANPGSNSFHFSLEIRAAAATVPTSDQTMTANYTDTVVIPSGFPGAGSSEVVTFNATGPTIFGDETIPGTATATGASGASYTTSTIQGLVKTSLVPFPIPQVSVGTIMGTDATVRFLPSISLGSFGSIGFWGVAARHSISQYLGGENAPVDIAVQVGFQGLSLKDSTGFEIVKNSAFMANVEVSKSFSLLTLYGGLQTEKSSMDIAYHYTNSFSATPVEIKFTMDGSNTFRAIVGANLGLGPINLNADYNMGTISVISGGLCISF